MVRTGMFRQWAWRIAGALACLALFLGSASARGGKGRDEGMPAAASLASYAGSAACQDCHAAQYAHWSGQVKSRFVRLREAAELPSGLWTGAPMAGDQAMVVVGLQRKLAFVDRDWRVFPREFMLNKGKWRENARWRGADYRLQCGPCHLTAVERDTAAFKEMNVGCECCHGPGRRHVETQAVSDIRTPGKADAGPALATCRRCHNDRNNHDRAIQGWQGPYHPR